MQNMSDAKARRHRTPGCANAKAVNVTCLQAIGHVGRRERHKLKVRSRVEPARGQPKSQLVAVAGKWKCGSKGERGKPFVFPPHGYAGKRLCGRERVRLLSAKLHRDSAGKPGANRYRISIRGQRIRRN